MSDRKPAKQWRWQASPYTMHDIGTLYLNGRLIGKVRETHSGWKVGAALYETLEEAMLAVEAAPRLQAAATTPAEPAVPPTQARALAEVLSRAADDAESGVQRVSRADSAAHLQRRLNDARRALAHFGVFHHADSEHYASTLDDWPEETAYLAATRLTIKREFWARGLAAYDALHGEGDDKR